MKSALACVLTINSGSSSIRFAVYEAGETPRRVLDGKIDRIGLSGTTLLVNDSAGKPQAPRRLAAADHRTAVGFLLDWFEEQPVFASVQSAGHRVVHGMTHSEPARVTPKLLEELHRITPYAPDHLPREIALIEAFRQRNLTLPQVACFDTAFHRQMPRVAKLLPLPRRYAAKGAERMTAAQFQQMVNHESGLLGVSGTSSDLRDLCASEAAAVRAAEAVALFCYQTKKWIGSFAAALGGLDALVFAGGIGEKAPLIRERICDGLGFLGIELNRKRNGKNAPLISPDAARVKVRVIRTDEELMIARSVCRALGLGVASEKGTSGHGAKYISSGQPGANSGQRRKAERRNRA